MLNFPYSYFMKFYWNFIYPLWRHWLCHHLSQFWWSYTVSETYHVQFCPNWDKCIMLTQEILSHATGAHLCTPLFFGYIYNLLFHFLRWFIKYYFKWPRVLTREVTYPEWWLKLKISSLLSHRSYHMTFKTTPKWANTEFVLGYVSYSNSV